MMNMDICSTGKYVSVLTVIGRAKHDVAQCFPKFQKAERLAYVNKSVCQLKKSHAAKHEMKYTSSSMYVLRLL